MLNLCRRQFNAQGWRPSFTSPHWGAHSARSFADFALHCHPLPPDQHERLATRVAEGAGVAGELVGLVEHRDAQVMALKGQAAADGVLLGRSR